MHRATQKPIVSSRVTYRYASKLTFPLCKACVEQLKPPNSGMRSQKTICSTMLKTPKEIHASFPSSSRMPFTATPNNTSSQRQLLERNIAYNKHVLEPDTFLIYAYKYEGCSNQNQTNLSGLIDMNISRSSSECCSAKLSLSRDLLNILSPTFSIYNCGTFDFIITSPNKSMDQNGISGD